MHHTLVRFLLACLTALTVLTATTAPSFASAEDQQALPSASGDAGTNPTDSSSVERPPLVLGVGEQRQLRIEGLSRFSIGGPQIRALVVRGQSGSPLLLKAAQPGVTDLWTWRSNGPTEHRRIRVEKPGTAGGGLKPEILHALSELNEVEILYAGPSVVLRGEVRSVSEAARLEALERSLGDPLRNETRLSESLLAAGESALLSWLRTSPWKNSVRLERVAGQLRLDGNLPRAKDLDFVRRRARTLFPPVRLELESLPDDAPTVHFRVYLLELRKNRWGALGMAWPPGQEAAFRVTTAAIQDLLQLDLALQSLEADGSVHILSKPELVVRAPGDAELFSGGQLPIQTHSHNYSNVSWKEFGLMLKLKVTHTTVEKVRLEIFTEVSHLDMTLATASKVPGIQANRMRTQVDARYGAPLLLSGLLQEGLRRTARGLPLLRDIPVLGALFGSEDWLNDKSELVAILVPSSTPPRAPMERFAAAIPGDVPRGPVPPPRDWIDPVREKELRASPDFPWNVWEIRASEVPAHVDL